MATTRYSIGGLSPFSEYEFRVIAVNNIGRGPPSELVEARTGEQAPSSPPLKVQARMLSASTMLVQWEQPEEPNGQIRGYRVYYTTDPHLPLSMWQKHNTDDSHLTTVGSLITGTTYSIRVLAFTSVGDGPPSDIIQVKTQQGGTYEVQCCSSVSTAAGSVQLSCVAGLHQASQLHLVLKRLRVRVASPPHSHQIGAVSLSWGVGVHLCTSNTAHSFVWDTVAKNVTQGPGCEPVQLGWAFLGCECTCGRKELGCSQGLEVSTIPIVTCLGPRGVCLLLGCSKSTVRGRGKKGGSRRNEGGSSQAETQTPQSRTASFPASASWH